MKKQSKIKEVVTKKLFYKKWLYKIVIECGGISYLHRRGIKYVLTVEPMPSTNRWIRNSTDTIIQNRSYLTQIAAKLELILPMADHQIRVEGKSYSLFTNDENMINQVQNRLTSFVKEIHRPSGADQADFLLSNKNKVICEELPHENFRFKIYFKNGDAKLDHTTRFVAWADKFDDGRVYIPTGTRKILTGNSQYTTPYFYGQYFYVKDQKMASMALMVMGDMLNKTEEFVLKSEVNA